MTTHALYQGPVSGAARATPLTRHKAKALIREAGSRRPARSVCGQGITRIAVPLAGDDRVVSFFNTRKAADRWDRFLGSLEDQA